jgi:NADH:ubiquinone oxidoreductase subunit
MNLSSRLFTWLRGRQVGADAAGNRYFIEREPSAPGVRLRRWVMYPGAAAASPVPAGWQAWLSYGGGGTFRDTAAAPVPATKP